MNYHVLCNGEKIASFKNEDDRNFFIEDMIEDYPELSFSAVDD